MRLKLDEDLKYRKWQIGLLEKKERERERDKVVLAENKAPVLENGQTKIWKIWTNKLECDLNKNKQMDEKKKIVLN